MEYGDGRSVPRSQLVGLYGSQDGTLVNEKGVGVAELNEAALDVVDEYLGPVVAAVAETLVRFGELDLRKIEMYAKRLAGTAETLDPETELGRPRRAFKELNRDNIKGALVNMVRHNVVKMETREIASATASARAGKLRPQKATYKFCAQRALMLLRHPLICSVVEKRLGALAAVIVEEVLISGADSKKGILDSVAVRVGGGRDAVALAAVEALLEKKGGLPDDWNTDHPDEASLEEILQRPEAVAARELAKSELDRLITRRVIVPQKKFSVRTEEEERELEETARDKKRATGDPARRPAAAAAKPARKRKQPDSSVALAVGVEVSSQAPSKKARGGNLELRRRLEAAGRISPTPSGDGRHSPASGAVKSPKNAPDSNVAAAGKRRMEEPQGGNGAKRRREGREAGSGVEFDVDEFPLGDPRGALWFRFNINYFLQCFRADLIAAHFEGRAEDPAYGKILSVVMEATINVSVGKSEDDRDEFDLPPDTLVAVCADTIYEELKETTELQGLIGHVPDRAEAVVRLNIALKSLGDCSNGVVHVDDVGTGDPASVSIDLDGAVRELKRRCMLKQISSEYGLEGLRIANLLLAKKALEEAQVGELALLAPHKARHVLQAMLKDGYLFLEEACKRPDMNPAYTYFVWRALDTHMEQVVAANALKALLNLRIRKRVEHAEGARLDEVAYQVERFKNGVIDVTDLRKVQGFEEYTRIRFNVDNLEKILVDLDKTVLLLSALSEMRVSNA